MNFIKAYFPPNPNARILEIGCGHGALIYFARIMNYKNIEGVDISEDQIRCANELGVAGIHQDDLRRFLANKPDNSLDMTVAIDVFEHLSKSELFELIREIYRTLDTNGKLLIHVPNAVSPFHGRIRYGDYTHEQAFTQSSITQLLSAGGFAEINCFEESPIVHGIRSAIRWMIWKASRTLMSIVYMAETGVINEIFSQNFVAVAYKRV
jgi:cyclopropane fatty-acyl-phospholipid synthase-like methyltransferase